MLRAAVAAAGPSPVIVDVGCGTGSTVRALGALLPEGAQWHLVDNDPVLLEHAGAEAPGRVTLHCQDIQALDTLPLRDATLITGSALLDIVSRQWLVALADRARVPLYFALSYDGDMSWNPGDARDVEVTAAFNAHQRGDKGFGPALGPDAAAVARDVFAASGWTVSLAKSPWRLGPSHEALQRELVAGIAAAANDAGNEDALRWGETRVADAVTTQCTIGHTDLLALPQTSVTGAAHA